jgi:nucleoside-diphosphate-sugar epimerase
MKVIVTGATGHLGSYTVARLAELGHEVVAASRRGTLPALRFGDRERPESIRTLALDLRSDEAVPLLRRELGRDVGLIHLAAWHPPATASTGPAERGELLETNVRGTMRVLEAARQPVAASAVVYSSSFEVYAEPRSGGPIAETGRLGPVTDYGATKLAGEDHLMSFGYEERVRVLALRLPAIYGPGERTARALPNFLRAVSRGSRPKIFGDGSDLRDQIHVRDAADALVRGLTAAAGGVFNVADGMPHSILELAQTAMLLAGMPGAPELCPREKPRRDFHMDIDRARAELEIAPAIALSAGMAEELAWMRAEQKV